MLRRWMLLRMKLTERQLNDIVQEEVYIYLIDKLLSEVRYDPSVQWKPFKTREEWAKDVLRRRDAAKASGIPADRPDAADQFEAEQLERDGFPPHRSEFVRQAEPAKVSMPMKRSAEDLALIASKWDSFINNTNREAVAPAIAQVVADGRLSKGTEYHGMPLLDILKSLYDKLRAYDSHSM